MRIGLLGVREQEKVSHRKEPTFGDYNIDDVKESLENDIYLSGKKVSDDLIQDGISKYRIKKKERPVTLAIIKQSGW